MAILSSISKSCTTLERKSLADISNLSDAHCRQPLVVSEGEIIDSLASLFHRASRIPTLDVEQEFIKLFFLVAGQKSDLAVQNCELSYSASSAITMAASLLRRSNKSVALVAPCFDNIPRILIRENVALFSVPEYDVFSKGIPESKEAYGCDVLWVTCPNNPTGVYLDKDSFCSLVNWCVKNSKLLVLDCSFRFFCPSMATWQQYDILYDSGVSFIVIEDTGKTWPTSELKVSITVSSTDIFPDIHKMHDDLLQCVSPFGLLLICEFIRNSLKQGLDSTVHKFVKENRNLLRKSIISTEVRPTSPDDSLCPVEWLMLPSKISGRVLQEELLSRNVHILPGSNFYWANPRLGERFVRLALSRPTSVVSDGARALVDVINKMQRE